MRRIASSALQSTRRSRELLSSERARHPRSCFCNRAQPGPRINRTTSMTPRPGAEGNMLPASVPDGLPAPATWETATVGKPASHQSFVRSSRSPSSMTSSTREETRSLQSGVACTRRLVGSKPRRDLENVSSSTCTGDVGAPAMFQPRAPPLQA